jgi:putative RNA 2'-phosphotransferase
MDNQLKNISKLLSLVLRHQPEYLGIHLNENGWTDVSILIEKINEHGSAVDMHMIEQIVETNDKKRFAFNDNKTLIRASQGHSIDVDVELQQAMPPEILFHGTTLKNLTLILEQGLQKQTRRHVHLSSDEHTAKAVGSRHGTPCVLLVNAKAMYEKGYSFYLSENMVWLTDHVPVEFIKYSNGVTI